jgi:hypothetical protein
MRHGAMVVLVLILSTLGCHGSSHVARPEQKYLARMVRNVLGAAKNRVH